MTIFSQSFFKMTSMWVTETAAWRTNAKGWKRIRPQLREFPPRSFGRPPNELAAADDNDAQRNPLGDARRKDGKDNNRGDHRQIIWSGVAAMCATTTPVVRNASDAHPSKGHGPDDCTNRHGSEQADKQRRVRKPPCNCIARRIREPVARGLNRGHDAQQLVADSACIGGHGTEP